MGNVFRKESPPPHNGPRSFFLVVGKPIIRYTRPSGSGPLIFNVEVDQEDDERNVQRAETVRLPANVPSKQSFQLHQRDANNEQAGFYLSFKIHTLAPPRSVRVYAGVNIEYIDNVGVQLQQSESSQSPFCVFEQYDFDSSGTLRLEELQQPIFLHRLKSAAPPEELGAPRSLTHCPLAIELAFDILPTPAVPAEDDTDVENAPLSGACGDATTTPISAIPSRRGNTLRPSPRTPTAREEEHPPTAPPAAIAAVQYTFLDFPKEALEGPGPLQTLLRPESGPANAEAVEALPTHADAAPVPTPATTLQQFPCKLLKQYLQFSNEVFELDDVFDLGGDDVGSDGDDANDGEEETDGEGSANRRRRQDAAPAQGAEEIDEDASLCVVCLSSPRDTTIIPCRHMCLCYECAMQMRHQSNSCPICRRNIDRLMTL